jgi:hypothetical protein
MAGECAGFAFRLRDLGVGARAGLSCLLLVLLGGFAASGAHLIWHHEMRDEHKGLSLDDVKGAYHGIQTRAPLLVAMERKHPPELPAAERKALEDWLKGGRINQEYDNLEKGAMAPSEIIAKRCVSCHAGSATQGGDIGKKLPLETFDQVMKAAISREVYPIDVKGLAASTHAHALSLGMLTIVVAGLALATRWPRRLVGGAILTLGLALLVDMGAWWAARPEGGAVYAIVVAGGVYNGGMVAALLGILLDVWAPRRAGDAGGG